MRFARGEITQELKIVGTTNKTGTTVTFKPDGDVFDETFFNYDTLLTRMREQAFLIAGLKIRLIDARLGHEAGRRDALRGRHPGIRIVHQSEQDAAARGDYLSLRQP
jgi:DNA gyrase/topoisomerase IV subunit B